MGKIILPIAGLALLCIMLTIRANGKVTYYNQKLHTNYTVEQFMSNGDEIERVEIPNLVKIQKDSQP